MRADFFTRSVEQFRLWRFKHPLRGAIYVFANVNLHALALDGQQGLLPGRGFGFVLRKRGRNDKKCRNTYSFDFVLHHRLSLSRRRTI